MMEEQRFPNGLTVVEFKSIVARWPEQYANGDPTEVWIETGLMMSSPVVVVAPLNVRYDAADLILESSAFESDSSQKSWIQSTDWEQYREDIRQVERANDAAASVVAAFEYLASYRKGKTMDDTRCDKCSVGTDQDGKLIIRDFRRWAQSLNPCPECHYNNEEIFRGMGDDAANRIGGELVLDTLLRMAGYVKKTAQPTENP